MHQTISKYISKRAEIGKWSFESAPQKDFYDFFITIPVCDELEYLFKTFESISLQNKKYLRKTLVTLVVNNSVDCNLEIYNNNQQLLNQLKNRFNFNFEFCYIDASSKGKELPAKHAGVGLARKIGIDSILKYTHAKSIICSTDADTLLSKDYLDKINSYFKKTDCNVAVTSFYHQDSKDEVINKAIREYEKFLYKTALKLRRSGSQYGFPALGSAIVFKPLSYAAAGGMPRLKATEDFYFLQNLAKYTKVHLIKHILVHPSSRATPRIYLGTSFRMKQVKEGFDICSLYYSDYAFTILKQWLQLGSSSALKDVDYVLNKCKIINEDLVDHLIVVENIITKWQGIQNSSGSQDKFSSQFHRWFDGLKTLRLLKRFSS